MLRSVLSWAWFRPSQEQWGQGARWYRCDIVGGTPDAARYLDLPTDARGILTGLEPDAWMACVDGASVTRSPWTPCSEPHQWRAVTSVQVAKDTERWPGDRLMEVRSRDYCSDSVGAWMNYPVEYSFAYTWFHEAEWDLGLRRTVCWAKIES